MGIVIQILLLMLSGSISPDNYKIKAAPVNGALLKTQGYYYSVVPDSTGYSMSLYFLFLNGAVNYIGPVSCKDTSRGLETLLYDSQIIGAYYRRSPQYRKQHQISWGRFGIKDNHITIEIPVATAEGYPVLRTKGSLLNDSTFLTQETRFEWAKVHKNITWRFKSYPIKSDSLEADYFK
jgi:hypothetical protein